jgi:hypothetical protein
MAAWSRFIASTHDFGARRQEYETGSGSDRHDPPPSRELRWHGISLWTQGGEIPLGARIIALADAYVTLEQKGTRQRTYHRKQILAILKKMAGRRLDPKLFDIFRELELPSPKAGE